MLKGGIRAAALTSISVTLSTPIAPTFPSPSGRPFLSAHSQLRATRDGSLIAQLGPPDMRVPIANCLAWPERMAGAARLDFAQMTTLTFEAPDPIRFPALALARQALQAGNGVPTVLNAANEIAVHEFIGGRLGFAGIAALVDATIDAAEGRGIMREPTSVDDAIAVDHISRSLARSLLPEIAVKAF